MAEIEKLRTVTSLQGAFKDKTRKSKADAVRAANNTGSSDISQPKFASIQCNPTCVGTLCPENFFYRKSSHSKEE